MACTAGLARTRTARCSRIRGSRLALACVAALGLLAATSSRADEAAPRRVEARSATLLAVGVVHGDRMSIHISRLADNAPVRDALLAVMLRGVAHPTVAEADGGYTLQTTDLELPGAAAVEFQITQGAAREVLKADLAPSAGSKPEEKNSARQLGWWVLNFAVCIGFLWLWSRRREAKREQDAASQD